VDNPCHADAPTADGANKGHVKLRDPRLAQNGKPILGNSQVLSYLVPLPMEAECYNMADNLAQDK
jgi:hypothetical protein